MNKRSVYFQEYYKKNKEKYISNAKKNKLNNKSKSNLMLNTLNELNNKIDELSIKLNDLTNIVKGYDNDIKTINEHVKDVKRVNFNNIKDIKELNGLNNHNHHNRTIKSEKEGDFKFNNSINQPKDIVNNTNNKLSKKRITIMVDKRILDIIEETKIPFNNFFNNSLLFLKENKLELEAYPLKSKIRKDIRMSLEIDEIYRSLPEKNKMCYVNDLLSKYIKNNENK